jgi:sulfur carrier protein ThiS
MKIVYRDREWELRGGMTARAAVKKLELDPEAILVIRNGKLVTDDTLLEGADEVKLIAVISGGMGRCVVSKGWRRQ